MPCRSPTTPMTIYKNIQGVPQFQFEEFYPKSTRYCILIPVINEGERIQNELRTAQQHGIGMVADIILCDGGSTDGSTAPELLRSLGSNSLLIKQDTGKQGAQLRMGFWWALQRGYDGFITVDGNNKDSIEDIPKFIEKLDEGYDFVQGSRYLKGGQGINTPLARHIAVRWLHAPIISLTARHRFTDTTNAYRAYSKKYITHPAVQPFRDIFFSYELLAYLSVRASQLGLSVCEIPVTRTYPKGEKTPTKITLKGCSQLLNILFDNWRGKFSP